VEKLKTLNAFLNLAGNHVGKIFGVLEPPQGYKKSLSCASQNPEHN
jgi:hypothetical protein